MMLHSAPCRWLHAVFALLPPVVNLRFASDTRHLVQWSRYCRDLRRDCCLDHSVLCLRSVIAGSDVRSNVLLAETFAAPPAQLCTLIGTSRYITLAFSHLVLHTSYRGRRCPVFIARFAMGEFYRICTNYQARC